MPWYDSLIASLPPRIPSVAPWYDVTSDLYWMFGPDSYGDYEYLPELNVWADPNGDWMIYVTPFWSGYQFEKIRVTYFGGLPTYGWLGLTDVDWNNYVVDYYVDGAGFSTVEITADWQPGFLFELIDVYTRAPQIVYKIEVYSTGAVPPGYSSGTPTPKVSILPANSTSLLASFSVTIQTTDTEGTVEIYYTLDGSNPRTSPTKLAYTEPFLCAKGITVFAYAVADNGESNMAMVSYTTPPEYNSPVDTFNILDSNSATQQLAVSTFNSSDAILLTNIINRPLEFMGLYDHGLAAPVVSLTGWPMLPLINVVGYTKVVYAVEHSDSAQKYFQARPIYHANGKKLRGPIIWGGWFDAGVKLPFICETYGCEYLGLEIFSPMDKFTIKAGRV